MKKMHWTKANSLNLVAHFVFILICFAASLKILEKAVFYSVFQLDNIKYFKNSLDLLDYWLPS